MSEEESDAEERGFRPGRMEQEDQELAYALLLSKEEAERETKERQRQKDLLRSSQELTEVQINRSDHGHSRLLRIFKHVQQTGLHSDVTLVLKKRRGANEEEGEEERIKAHKLVLMASSDVFCKALGGPVEQRDQGAVSTTEHTATKKRKRTEDTEGGPSDGVSTNIQADEAPIIVASSDEEPLQLMVQVEEQNLPAFHAMLEWMYQGSVSVGVELVLPLLQVSHVFGVEELNRSCGVILTDNITTHTVFDVLTTAERFHCETLCTACAEFIGLNLYQLYKQKKLFDITLDTWELILQVSLSPLIIPFVFFLSHSFAQQRDKLYITSEEKLFRMVKKYAGTFADTQRDAILERLLPSLRWQHMASQFLFEKVERDSTMLHLPLTHKLLHDAYRSQACRKRGIHHAKPVFLSSGVLQLPPRTFLMSATAPMARGNGSLNAEQEWPFVLTPTFSPQQQRGGGHVGTEVGQAVLELIRGERDPKGISVQNITAALSSMATDTQIRDAIEALRNEALIYSPMPCDRFCATGL
ncbi:hypothetical protein QOT17_011032 [Balamuthia mandrillaris]